VAAAAVEALAAAETSVVAVDIASGVMAASGAIPGPAVRAALTVSFCTAKPGHLLLPGRLATGRLVVADIGISPEAIAAEDGGLRVNGPSLWRDRLPARTADSHKYRFGHAAVLGGPSHASGAARLAADAALRVGAGLVTVLAAPEALRTYAARLTAVMTRAVETPRALAPIMADRRMTAALIGPGAGVNDRTRGLVAALLATGKPLVLDADALTSLTAALKDGSLRLHADCLLTPHDGEFARLFEITGDRLHRARTAAAECGAHVLLKGADTVVAAPDGRATILLDAPPTLATAGTGDVLAGLALGLLAQGVPTFEAGSAAAYLHAATARRIGRQLTAEDLLEEIASSASLDIR
jgi:NAD(P)H-hydrate epimerase